jgi:hypothetical protein
MTQEDLIVEELRSNSEALASFRDDGSPTAQIMRAQIERRNESLERKLDESRNPALELVLGGEAMPSGRIPAELLGALVSRFQRAVTWTASAIRFGPAAEKEPPASIRHGTALDIVAVGAGSFRIRMRRPPLDDERQQRIAETDRGVFEKSVETILNFAETAERGEFSEGVEGQARAIGPRPASILRLFVKKLADSGSNATFDWRSTEARHVFLSASSARALSDWLGSVEYEQREQTILGVLVAADTERGTFAIRDVDGNLYPGKAAPDLVDSARINGVYEARVRVVTSIGEHVGSTVDRYELLELIERSE